MEAGGINNDGRKWLSLVRGSRKEKELKLKSDVR